MLGATSVMRESRRLPSARCTSNRLVRCFPVVMATESDGHLKPVRL